MSTPSDVKRASNEWRSGSEDALVKVRERILKQRTLRPRRWARGSTASERLRPYVVAPPTVRRQLASSQLLPYEIQALGRVVELRWVDD
jgi:hypothetical protein